MIRTFLLLCAWSLSVISQAQITLESCKQQARENYPLVRQYDLIQLSEQYTLSNVAKGNLPQISVSGKISYQSEATTFPFEIPGLGMKGLPKDQYQALIEIKQNIWDGGKIRNQKAQVKAEAEEHERQLDTSLYALEERVNQVFFGILLLDEQLAQNVLLEEVTDALCRMLPAVFITCFQLLGALYFLSYLDMRLTIVLVFIMPVALLFSKGYIRKMRRLSREIRTTDSEIQSHLQENLQHRILLRTLEYTSQSVHKLDAVQSVLQDKVKQRTDFSVFSRSMVQVGFMTGYAVAFLWGVFGLREGTVTFGMMAAFLQLVSQIQRPMVDLSRQIPAAIRVLTSAERLIELTDLPLEERGESVRLEGNLGIRMHGVSYTYPEGSKAVMSDFTYDFKPGSLTAIVGETGVGKSTLIRLILALLRPDRGDIVFYNGQQEVVASPLTRCNLSYVPQGNTLVSGTIRDNLRMGNPHATEEELKEALYLAVADFVFDLPEGMDTLCGERGSGLSEGQAQRIAIARGLLRPGSILLLDEPTSSLDSETEKLLLARLSDQLHGKTLLLISHRETIAQLCTSVVWMKKQE